MSNEEANLHQSEPHFSGSGIFKTTNDAVKAVLVLFRRLVVSGPFRRALAWLGIPVRRFERSLTSFFKIAGVLTSFVVAALLAYDQLSLSPTFRVEPISVPKRFEEDGVTAVVLSRRLVQAARDVQDEALEFSFPVVELSDEGMAADPRPVQYSAASWPVLSVAESPSVKFGSSAEKFSEDVQIGGVSLSTIRKLVVGSRGAVSGLVLDRGAVLEFQMNVPGQRRPVSIRQGVDGRDVHEGIDRLVEHAALALVEEADLDNAARYYAKKGMVEDALRVHSRMPRKKSMFFVGLVKYYGGDYPGAAVAFGKVAEQDPGSWEVRVMHAASLVAAGDSQRALRTFQDAPAPRRHRSTSLHILGLLHSLVGDMKQAEQDYREAIKAGEGEDVVYQSWGNALAHVGRLREAIERYGQAIEWNGENAQCFHNLATVQVRYSGSRPSEESGVLRSASQQNFARAETLYKRKVERENQVAAKVLLNRLYFDWGSALVSVGDKAGARQKLSHVNPGVASNTRGGLSLDLGRQLMILGDLEAAVSRFGEALEADPRNEQAYSALGGAQMRLRRYSEAVTSYRRAIDISNSSRRKAELYLGLGNAYYRSGDDRAAVQAYDKGLEVDPRNRRLLLNCGTVLTMQGELNEALKRLDNLWRLDPERPPPELLVGLGNVYSEFGWREADPGKAKAQFQVALQRYQRALGIATGKELLCSIHNNVAVAQNGLARFDLARDALTSAGAVCPLGDPDLLSTHAEFYGLQGDKEKFAEYLQKALEAGLRVDDRHLELRPYVTYKNDPSIKPMLERLRVAPPRRGP